MRLSINKGLRLGTYFPEGEATPTPPTPPIPPEPGYYISNTGSDLADGLTPATAWETIAQVNGSAFLPGDIIHFKKGDIWRDTLEIPSSGDGTGDIEITNYDSGVNPQILGSDATITWADQGGNVWKCNQAFTNPRALYPFGADVTFIELDSSKLFGTLVANVGALAAEYDWVWDTNEIYVYSTSDPATAYTGIEVPQRRFCISTNDNEYLFIDGINAFYSADIGFDTNSDHADHIDITNCRVENCEVGFIGGISGPDFGFGMSLVYTNLIVRDCTIHHCGRRGLSLNLIGAGVIFTATNALIEDNIFYAGYHTTSLDCNVNNGGNDASWDGIIFRNNFIYEIDPVPNSTNQIFLQKYVGAGDLKNVYIYNNIFKNVAGNAISIERTDSTFIWNNTFYEHSGSITPTYFIYADTFALAIEVKNNAFYTTLANETSGNGAELVNFNMDDAEIDANYNCYYRINNALRIMLITGNSYYMNTALPTPEGYEANGLQEDQLFISAVDYHLQLGSPCRWAGVNVGLATDRDGVAYHNPPSIGCYEYV